MSDDPNGGRPHGHRLLLGSAVAAAALAPTLGVIATLVKGVSAVLTVAAATLVSAGWAAVAQHQVGRKLRGAKLDAIESRKRLAVVLKQVAPPLMEKVAEVSLTADPAVRQRALGQLQQQAVAGAVQGCGDDRTRCTLYLIERHVPGDTHEAPHGLNRCMKFICRYGRQDKRTPRAWFCSQQGPEDREVMTVVAGLEGKLYADISVDPPPGVSNTGMYAEQRAYKSLMFTPIRHDDTYYGMLSVDHPDPHMFDVEHLQHLNMLALALAAGLAVDRSKPKPAGAAPTPKPAPEQQPESALTTPDPADAEKS